MTVLMRCVVGAILLFACIYHGICQDCGALYLDLLNGKSNQSYYDSLCGGNMTNSTGPSGGLSSYCSSLYTAFLNNEVNQTVWESSSCANGSSGYPGESGYYNSSSGYPGESGYYNGSSGYPGESGYYNGSSGYTGESGYYNSSSGYPGESGYYNSSSGYPGESGYYNSSSGYPGESGYYNGSSGYPGESGYYNGSSGYPGESGYYNGSSGYPGESGYYNGSSGYPGNSGYSAEYCNALYGLVLNGTVPMVDYEYMCAQSNGSSGYTGDSGPDAAACASMLAAVQNGTLDASYYESVCPEDTGEDQLGDLLESFNASAITSPDALDSVVAAISNTSSTNTDQLQQVRDMAVSAMLNVIDSVTDEAGLAKVADSLSSITDSDASGITEATMDKALDASESILNKMSSNANLGNAALTQISTAIVGTISNLLSTTLGDDPASNVTDSANATAAKAARAEKSEQLVNSIGDTILGGMNTSSPPVVINTKSVAMTLQKVAGSQAAAGNFTTSSTTIKINGALATTEPVNVKLVAMADNAFKYAPGGSNVTSGVTTFEMKTDSGQMAALDGGFVEAEVGAAMKFEETQASMENMTTDNGISQTIAIQDAAILLSFDIPPDQTLVFLGKLDGEATKQSYDFRFVVSSAVESSDKNIDVNEEFDNGTLVIVVPQEALGTAQKLGLSVLLAEESATSSGGGSSRRLLSTGGNGTLSMRSTAITPSSYNRTSKSWGSPSGLKIKGASKSNKVVFKSNFFGSFAAGLFVPPNTIDFGKVFGNFSALLAQAPHVLIVMSSLVALYFLLLIWARRKDKQDMENWVHHHLLENQRWDQQHYLLSVFTSSKSPKHTTAIPYVILYGTEGRTKPKVLLDRSRENFKRGKVCNFVLSTPRSLGRLTHLHVWHCQVDDASSWHLDKITVYDVTTKDRFLFLCDEWLSICKDDGNTDRLLTAADETALEDFSFLLSNNAKKKIFDDHLWFSVAKRPTPSRLTRVQRLTTCLAVLFLCMISNAMFYTENEDKGNGIAIGPIVITFRQVYVGLIASVLVVPPTFIMLEVFRRSRPRKTDKSIFPYKADKWAVARKALVPEEKDEKMFKAVENVLALHKESKTNDDKSDLVKAIAEFDEMMRESPPPPPETPAKPSKPPRKPVRFPWWFVVFGYILAFVAVFTSAFFTLLYSLEWGATKSTNWLLALFFALGESVLVVQPLQVLLLALIMSIIMRMPGDDETDDDFVIEEHVLLPYNYTIPKAVFVPMADTTIDEEEIKMRKLQKKHEQKLSGVVNDIAVHLGYLFLLLVICFANRDPNFFLQNDNLRNSLSLDDGTFSEIQRIETIFSWLNGTIFPAVFPDTDYTGATLDAYDQQFLHDIYALRLGPLRLRQHRVVQGHCTVIPHMTNLFNSCNTDYTFERQDRVNYQTGWEAGLNAGVDASATAFNHTSPNGDKDLWVSGLFSLYDGGGYAVEVNSLAEGITVLNTLLANNWIDRLTRVVFVEFTINNMNVNVFSMVRIKLELPAIGGIFVTRELVSFRPYPYVNPFDFILLVIQVIWAIVVFYLLVKESISMFKKRSKYFKVLWNYAILIDLLFAVASMVCFVLRTVYVIRSVEDVKNNNGHFVGFDLVANWDFGYSLTIAISLFVATLHLFRPLSFHKLLSILSTTLTRSFLDLLSYAVIFIICLFTFGLTLMVNSGSVLAAFRAIAFAMFNLFGVMLGVLKYTDVITEETFLLKVFFFIFTMSMNFMLLNMFISIINDTLAELKTDESKQEYDKELAEYLSNKMNSWVDTLINRKKKSKLSRKKPAINDIPTVAVTTQETNDSTTAPPIDTQQVLLEVAGVEDNTSCDKSKNARRRVVIRSATAQQHIMSADTNGQVPKKKVKKRPVDRDMETAMALAEKMSDNFLKIFKVFAERDEDIVDTILRECLEEELMDEIKGVSKPKMPASKDKNASNSLQVPAPKPKSKSKSKKRKGKSKKGQSDLAVTWEVNENTGDVPGQTQ